MARFGRGFPVPRKQARFPKYYYTTIIGQISFSGVSGLVLDGTELQLLIVSVAPATGTTSEGYAYPAGIGLYGIGSVFQYSGEEAAAGTLVQSMTGMAGSDGYGNDVPAGVMTFQLTLSDVSQPGTPSSGCVMYYSGGTLYALGPSGTPVAIATT